jgi:hypothetical protein
LTHLQRFTAASLIAIFATALWTASNSSGGAMPLDNTKPNATQPKAIQSSAKTEKVNHC